MLKHAVDKDPTNALSIYHLGMAYFEVGDWKKSRESLERALKISSTFLGAEDAKTTLASIRG